MLEKNWTEKLQKRSWNSDVKLAFFGYNTMIRLPKKSLANDPTFPKMWKKHEKQDAQNLVKPTDNLEMLDRIEWEKIC